jgi:hypothetical protein
MYSFPKETKEREKDDKGKGEESKDEKCTRPDFFAPACSQPFSKGIGEGKDEIAYMKETPRLARLPDLS